MKVEYCVEDVELFDLFEEWRKIHINSDISPISVLDLWDEEYRFQVCKWSGEKFASPLLWEVDLEEVKTMRMGLLIVAKFQGISRDEFVEFLRSATKA